jgi:putative oxygen-independent coproporphyrinogen III oxidase
MSLPLTLYIHIPWCIRKCPYCDFNSYITNDIPEEKYLQTLAADLSNDLSEIKTRTLNSIFIGGGTPTLLSPKFFDQLLEQINILIPLKDNLEITIEANPGTVNLAKLKDLYSMRINRISLGAQSFQDDKLKTIGRIHNHRDIVKAIYSASKAGFQNINLDLMYGLPEQTIADALNDIKIASSFSPTHLSWYQLSIEPNTTFYQQQPKLPNEDTIFNIQTHGLQLLKEQGFERYEISAYSKNSWQCIHNLNYWQFGDYLGIGAGAHSKITNKTTGSISITRKNKHQNPKIYMEQNKEYSSAISTISSAKELTLEFMMNILRLCYPIDLNIFPQRTGIEIKELESKLIAAKQHGFIEINGNSIQTSELGRNFLNDLLALFI